MERLPSELRYKIFAIVDNLNDCRLVSRSWNAMITDDILHRSVALLGTKPVFSFYEKRQDLASHVRCLFSCESSIERIFSLPRLFPNVQHLNLTLYHTTNEEEIRDEYRKQIESLDSIPHWTSSIASIRENNNSSPLFTTLWLETAAAAGEKLTNLTQLHIKMFDREFYRNNSMGFLNSYYSRKHQFLRSLRLAHALQHLTLEDMHVFWQDMDTIHDNVPDLRSLSLINTTLRFNENATYQIGYYNMDQEIERVSRLPIKQISSLKHLKIDLHAGKGLNGPQPHQIVKFWIQQMASMYTDLISFTLQSNNTMRSTNYKEEDTLSLLPMMAACQHLTVFEAILYPITHELLAAMDQSNIKLRTLRFDTTNNNDLKKQLTLLSNSDQSNHIKCLTMHSNYAGGYYEYKQKKVLKEELQPFDSSLFQPLSYFSRLTSLEYDCTFGRSCEMAHLIQILACCNSLKSLTMHHVSVSEEVPDTTTMTMKQFITHSALECLKITKLMTKRHSGSLVEINRILKHVMEGLQSSLKKLYVEIGSITRNIVIIEDAMADHLELDLSKLHQLKKLTVDYALGSSIITAEREDQKDTYEFYRNNYGFTKIPPPKSHYETKVILPQQAITINTLLVL